MKLFYYTLLILLLGTGCDQIDKDKYQLEYQPPIPEGADTRNILLEDYTGIRCSNCPKAAAKVVTLEDTYGKRLIPVSIHAGYFARPLGGYDLRTPAGEEYNQYFNISGNPQGIINRTRYEGSPFYAVDLWEKVIDKLPLRSPVSIEIVVHYQETQRAYSLQITIHRYHDLPEEPQHLVLWLIEDNIPTMQIIEDGSLTDRYMQRHVFRGALNGTWGESITLPTDNGGGTLIDKGPYLLPATYKATDCSIIAFICGENSNEIMQVNTIPLIPSIE